MGHNFNIDAINIFISYKKLEKIPTFFSKCKLLHCSVRTWVVQRFRAQDWNTLQLLEIFILPLGKHWTVCLCVVFSPLRQPGFSEGFFFFYSHIMQEKLLDWLCPTFWRDHNFWQPPSNTNSSLIGIFFQRP